MPFCNKFKFNNVWTTKHYYILLKISCFVNLTMQKFHQIEIDTLTMFMSLLHLLRTPLCRWQSLHRTHPDGPPPVSQTHGEISWEKDNALTDSTNIYITITLSRKVESETPIRKESAAASKQGGQRCRRRYNQRLRERVRERARATAVWTSGCLIGLPFSNNY